MINHESNDPARCTASQLLLAEPQTKRCLLLDPYPFGHLCGKRFRTTPTSICNYSSLVSEEHWRQSGRSWYRRCDASQLRAFRLHTVHRLFHSPGSIHRFLCIWIHERGEQTPLPSRPMTSPYATSHPELLIGSHQPCRMRTLSWRRRDTGLGFRSSTKPYCISRSVCSSYLLFHSY